MTPTQSHNNQWSRPARRAPRLTRSSFASVLLLFAPLCLADQLPPQLKGTWHIDRLLPTTNQGCWTPEQAKPLLGTTLSYSQTAMHWKGGDVHLTGIYVRPIFDNDLQAEFDGDPHPADFAQLQLKQQSVIEVNLQHPDAAILPASTEVPGDSILLAGPDRIVVSACGVYFEATRAHTPPSHARRR